MEYGKIFVSVRQRVAAFKYYCDYCGDYGWSYGAMTESEYLDAAYRFLNMSANKGFIAFCATREKMSFDNYCKAMLIDKYKLIEDDSYTTLGERNEV